MLCESNCLVERQNVWGRHPDWGLGRKHSGILMHTVWEGVKRDMETQSYGALVIVYSTMSESSRNFLYILFHHSVMKKSVENTALKIGV